VFCKQDQTQIKIFEDYRPDQSIQKVSYALTTNTEVDGGFLVIDPLLEGDQHKKLIRTLRIKERDVLKANQHKVPSSYLNPETQDGLLDLLMNDESQVQKG
jgi:hypothetical protein